MKLKDLIAPAFIGIVAYVVDALFKGPVGLAILLYSALPGVIDAIIALAAYAASDFIVSPYLGRTPYPRDLLLSLALGFIAFSLSVHYFLTPFRTSEFSLKSYYLSKYSHLKAILALVLIVARPLAYTRHTLGFVHIDRAYDAALAVLLFVYVLTPLYEYLTRGHSARRASIVLGKAEGSLKDLGVEISAREVGSYNGRIVMFEVKNEEPREKQFVLAIEAPDYRIPNVTRTRRLKPGETDEIFVLIRPSRYAGKRTLRVHVYDVEGKVREVVPGEDEERVYELYQKKFAIGKLGAFFLLILTPLAALLGPTIFLKIASLTLTALTLVATLAIGYLALRLVDKFTSTEKQRKVVTRLDEAVASLSLLALATFLIGLLLRSLLMLTITIALSLIVLAIAAISPIFAPAKVEHEELHGKLIELEPIDPEYFEEDLATRVELLLDADKIAERFGTNSFRVFLAGDDYIAPAVIEVENAKGIVRIPLRIIPDGFGERELIIRLGRLKDKDYVYFDDSDVLIDKSGKAAIFVHRYRAVPAGSSGMPKELQQVSMKAIGLVLSPTLILNILNRLGFGSSSALLSVIFGTIGALPILLYLYYKASVV